MDLATKDRFREDYLIAVYEKLGARYGPDGTLSRIALDLAEQRGVDPQQVFEDVLVYLAERGYFADRTQQWGGRLSAKGVDEAESLVREREERQASRPMTVQAPQKKREKVFGAWVRVGDCIGGGGNGQVYRAFNLSDTERQFPHAIKILNNPGDPDRLARMKREIEAVSRLDHPNVLKVVDYDAAAERPYLVTLLYPRQHLTFEYVSTLSYPDRMRLFAKICRGFSHVHSLGITHRDIKPENILLADDETPIVSDFGICHLVDAERHTRTGQVMASDFCRPPEVEAGRLEEVSPASDVYGLGKLLYWMLSGNHVPRERLREEAFDLTRREPRDKHAMAYELLERMILERPEDRLPNGNVVAELAESLAERMAMDAHVLNLDAPQPCHFCCAGEYKIKVDPRWWFPELMRPEMHQNEWIEHAKNQSRPYGIIASQGHPWLVLQCEHCGNVQMFQLSGGTDALRNWGIRPTPST